MFDVVEYSYVYDFDSVICHSYVNATCNRFSSHCLWSLLHFSLHFSVWYLPLLSYVYPLSLFLVCTVSLLCLITTPTCYDTLL